MLDWRLKIGDWRLGIEDWRFGIWDLGLKNEDFLADQSYCQVEPAFLSVMQTGAIETYLGEGLSTEPACILQNQASSRGHSSRL